MEKPNRQRMQDDFFRWAAIGAPIVATLFLFYNLYESRALPQLTGGVNALDIFLILIFTVLNIFLNLLLLEGVNMIWLGMIIVNLIALAIWYKYQPYQLWVAFNLMPFWISRWSMLP